MRQIIRSPRVDAELAEIFEFIAQDNIDAAFRFLEAAERCFQQLAAFPTLGTSGEFSNPLLAGLRRWRIKEFPNYLVFCRDSAEQVEVLYIVHGAQDLGGLFDA